MNIKLKILIFTAIIATIAGLGVNLAYAQTVDGEEAIVPKDTSALGFIAVGAGLSMGLAGLGAGVGLGTATSAIVAAGAERPEIIGRFFIFIVFVEAIAIYGLVVAIFIMTMLPGQL